MFPRLNTLILIGSIVVATASAPADAAPMSEKEWEHACLRLADASAEIMRARQSGVPMKKALERIPNTSSAGASMVKAMVMDAYNWPRYQTETMRKQAIQDFEDKFLSGCLNIRRK